MQTECQGCAEKGKSRTSLSFFRTKSTLKISPEGSSLYVESLAKTNLCPKCAFKTQSAKFVYHICLRRTAVPFGGTEIAYPIVTMDIGATNLRFRITMSVIALSTTVMLTINAMISLCDIRGE